MIGVGSTDKFRIRKYTGSLSTILPMDLATSDTDSWSDSSRCRHFALLLENEEDASALFKRYIAAVTWTKRRSQELLHSRPPKRRRVSSSLTIQLHTSFNLMLLLHPGRVSVLRNLRFDAFSTIYLLAMLVFRLLAEWPYEATSEPCWSPLLLVILLFLRHSYVFA